MTSLVLLLFFSPKMAAQFNSKFGLKFLKIFFHLDWPLEQCLNNHTFLSLSDIELQLLYSHFCVLTYVFAF